MKYPVIRTQITIKEFIIYIIVFLEITVFGMASRVYYHLLSTDGQLLVSYILHTSRNMHHIFSSTLNVCINAKMTYCHEYSLLLLQNSEHNSSCHNRYNLLCPTFQNQPLSESVILTFSGIIFGSFFPQRLFRVSDDPFQFIPADLFHNCVLRSE